MGCAGGVPRGSPLAAVVTPTFCAEADVNGAVAKAKGNRTDRKTARDFRKDILPLPQNRQPMPTRLLNELKL